MNEIIQKVMKEMLNASSFMDITGEQMDVRGERILAEGNKRNIPTILYRASKKNAPVIFAFFGGGYILGNYAMEDYQWDALRKELDVNVIAISYRKAPENPYPAAIEDAYEAIQYFMNHATEYAFNIDKYYTYGNSAGANLAIAVTMYDRKKESKYIKGNIVSYPYLDLYTEPEEKGHPEREVMMYHIFPEAYAKDEDKKNPLISPIFAEKGILKQMPCTCIIAGGADALKDEAQRYANKLQEANVFSKILISDDMPHGFIESYYAYCDSRRNDTEFFGEFLKECFENGILKSRVEEAMNFIKEFLNEN